MRKLLALAVLVIGCHAQVGSEATLPRDSAQTCASQCQTIGLGLDSVVVMVNNVGCICRAVPAPGAPTAGCAPVPPAPPPSGAAAGGGMAAALILSQSQNHQTTSPSTPPASTSTTR